MSSTINIRNKHSKTTKLSSVLGQRIVADSGQSNDLRLDSALGSHMNFTDGESNEIVLDFAQGNWIDLGETDSDSIVVKEGKDNIIDMRDSDSDTLDLRSGEGNVINLVNSESSEITLGSGSDVRSYDCGDGNELILHTAMGETAEDVQCLRYGKYRLIRFRNNFLIQKHEADDDDDEDFSDAPIAMTSDDVKLLPTRRLYSTVALKKRQCGICRCDFSEGNVLRMLPCFHEFHMQCIDEFLSINRVCPDCRQVVYG